MPDTQKRTRTKEENQQQFQPAYRELNPGYTGGRRVLSSPLRYPYMFIKKDIVKKEFKIKDQNYGKWRSTKPNEMLRGKPFELNSISYPKG